ncbi:uncharacterized protein LOC144110715 isoform X2 [Amblyomma americanum]
MAGEHDFSMALHELHPGRQCRSVSFDDGKRRVIATDLDPDVDPLNLKPVMGRPPTPRPSLTDCTISSSSPDGQYDELGDGSSRPSRAASEVLPMAMHEPYPGRQWRSVTFDDAKRRVIATNLDPEVDTLNLKSTVERPRHPGRREPTAPPLRRPTDSTMSWARAARGPSARPRRTSPWTRRR